MGRSNRGEEGTEGKEPYRGHKAVDGKRFQGEPPWLTGLHSFIVSLHGSRASFRGSGVNFLTVIIAIIALQLSLRLNFSRNDDDNINLSRKTILNSHLEPLFAKNETIINTNPGYRTVLIKSAYFRG